MINIVPVNAESDRSDRRDYLAMLTKFRQNYFRKNCPGDYDMNLFNIVKSNKIDLYLIKNNKTNIGIVELTNGKVGSQQVRCIGTIYIQPKYRKNNISKIVYSMIDKQYTVPVCLHIEQSNFEKNKEKFWRLGYVCYGAISDWCGDLQYNETTYMVFKKPFSKRLLPIKLDSYI
jgi:hypothetical protein